MIRKLRSLIIIVIAAALGAVLGRVVLEVRHRIDAGEPPESVDLRRVTVRIQDLVPGFVAAMRVRDVPWSWLHIPPWLAAFVVNLGTAAVGGDLSRLREMVERSAMSLAGMAPRDPEPAEAWESDPWSETAGGTAPDSAPRWDGGTPPSSNPGDPSGFSSFNR